MWNWLKKLLGCDQEESYITPGMVRDSAPIKKFIISETMNFGGDDNG